MSLPSPRSLNYGIYQQLLYKKQPDGTKFSDTAFVLTFACVFNALCATAWYFVQQTMPKVKVERDELPEAGRASPLPPFHVALFDGRVMLAAFMYVFAMFSSNESLKYVDYAYQALAKSCKLIPVMIGSMIIERATYEWTKYASVLGMTAGITAYEFLKDPKAAAGKHGGGGGGGDAHETSYMGIGLLALSLALDGSSGPSLKRLLSKKDGLFRSDTELQIATNIWATAYMLLVSAGLGQLGSSVDYLRAHPSLLWTMLSFGVCSGLGQVFIFFTLREFDALTTTTITTTRKFATIVYNAVLLPEDNKQNLKQWGCIAVVFGAVALDIWFEPKKHGSAKELKDGGAGVGAGGSGGAGGAGGSGGVAGAGGGKPASSGGGGAKEGGTPSKARRT